MRACQVLHLGIVEYGEAYRFQENLLAARQLDLVPDTLVLLQHPPVFTIGRAGSARNVLAPEWLLEQENIDVFESNRGGDVTYHGPGQLVVYPILRLADHGDDVHRYVRMVEETAIVLLAQYGIETGRIKEYPGVWAGPAKIGAVGIAIKGGVTMHGLAVNVDPNMAHFAMINPCGLGRPVTSMRQVLGWAPEVREVQMRYVGCFAQVFGVETMERFLESVWEYDQEIATLVDSAGAKC